MSWLLLFALFLPRAAGAEIIYAVASSWPDWQVFWFDSEAPGVPLGALSLHGDLDYDLWVHIEFDPVTDELYGFGVPNCQITCPPTPVEPSRIDLATGEATPVDWPDFPSGDMNHHDLRIDPATRELRAIGRDEENFRYSLNFPQLRVDTPLDMPGRYLAIAHPPPGGPHAGETLAIHYNGYGFTDSHLARIGGIGGDPPASSGQVTLLGDIEGPHFVLSFDISARGTAFLAGFPSNVPPLHLYELDLETLDAEDLGEIVPPPGPLTTYGIAAAPPGFGESVVEVPALSRFGLAALALLLAAVGLRCLRFR